MSIWDNLIFVSSEAGKAIGNGLDYGVHTPNSQSVIYKNAKHKSVLVYAAELMAIGEVYDQLERLFPRARMKAAKDRLDAAMGKENNMKKAASEVLSKQLSNYGEVDAGNGNKIYASDKYGATIRESLMIYYEDKDKQIEVSSDVIQEGGVKTTRSFFTNIFCHIDLAPEITISSGKNIVLTQVQGRDYTRKELVSGGDLIFNVSGKIVESAYSGIYYKGDNGATHDSLYPAEAVKKFVNIMQYNGILNVNCMFFNQLNVNRVIIKSFNLGKSDCYNEQPYSFECVAVEPDELIVKKDTIGVINDQLVQIPMDKWYDKILSNKLAQIIANSLVTSTESTLSEATSGLSELVKNI